VWIQASKITEKKGLDKPIFIVASLTLAVMFLAVLFTAFSGTFNDTIGRFLSGMGNVSTGSG
jgi:hypothetical protein